MATNNEFKDENPNKNMQISWVIFVLLFLVTVGIYGVNMSFSKKVEQLRTELNTQTTQINQLKQDKRLELFQLVEKNKTMLEKYKKMSQIPQYVNDVTQLAKNYRLDILGFSYNVGTIQSKVIAKTDETSFGSVKTKNFLEYFRKQDEHIFSLDFVKNFEWQNDVTFQTQFQVK